VLLSTFVLFSTSTCGRRRSAEPLILRHEQLVGLQDLQLGSSVLLQM
jgi:hypothetical protein